MPTLRWGHGRRNLYDGNTLQDTKTGRVMAEQEEYVYEPVQGGIVPRPVAIEPNVVSTAAGRAKTSVRSLADDIKTFGPFGVLWNPFSFRKRRISLSRHHDHLPASSPIWGGRMGME